MGDQKTPAWLSNATSLRTVLLASLGLNLFFAGWLVGARVVPWGFGPPPGPRQQFSEQLRRTLSEDGFKTVSRLVHHLETRRHQEFESTEPLRERIKIALTAQPFDREAFAKVLNELTTEIGRQHAELDKSIIDAVAGLTPDDRRRLAELPLPPPPRPPGGGFGANLLPIDRSPPR